MKHRILSSLVLVVLVLILIRLNQNTTPSSDQAKSFSSKISEPEKRNVSGHSAGRATLEQGEPQETTRSAELKPKEFESKYGELPTLLRGTRMDGELLSDAAGKLLILPSMKKRFDYFLSAVSEEGLETAIGRIAENISQTLPSDAAEEALSILYSYINYKKSLQNYLKIQAELPENSDHVAGLRHIIKNRMELRRKYMAPDVVEAYFGDQELYDEFSLKSLELHYDTELTAKEKQNEGRRLEKTLPEKIQNRRKREKDIESLYLKKQVSEAHLL